MAPPTQGSAHTITAHYSLTDLERMKGWVGLVGWPCKGWFTYVSDDPNRTQRDDYTFSRIRSNTSMSAALQPTTVLLKLYLQRIFFK